MYENRRKELDRRDNSTGKKLKREMIPHEGHDGI